VNDNLNEIIQVIKQVYNRDISQYDESFLQKSLSKRLAVEEYYKNINYGVYLAENSKEAQEFYDSLNITYSEFFRNNLTFALLEQLVIPSLIEEKKKAGGTEIRVWSAACAGGQEPYSLAILLDELTTARGNDINYRIFATDISDRELEIARYGKYDISLLQNMRLKHLQKYFIKTADSYQIIDSIKEKIEFSNYDLLDTSSSCPSMSIFGDFDMIICGNVLFYYRPDIRQRILNKAYYCLSPKGYFVTGEAEKDIVAKNDFFYPLLPSAAIFQRRNY
jgi:chemotaxis methyl-accepting protein methylase